MADPLASVMIEQNLIWTEWLMVAVFVGGVITWGLLMRKGAATLEGSFLAGRKVPGFIASLSTVATNLNANDFIGGAGVIYAVGVVMAHGKWANGLGLLVVSLFLVAKLRRMNVFTLGGWLEKRYSPALGIMYSITWSFVWMLFNLGLYLYAGALVLNTLMGWDLETSIIVLSAIAAFYTLIGGFGAVVATDVLQISLMFFPFLFLASAVWIDIGSARALAEQLPVDKAVYWASDTKFGPMSIFLVGTFLMGTSYWSTEAQVVQRPLSARSEEDATISYVGATFWLSLLMPLLITIPALAAAFYWPDLSNPDEAMPHLIRKYLPRGLYGVTVVGLIAGVFSSADSQINAFCTMFTTDIYKRLIRPDRSERHYLTTSKIAGVIFTLAAIGTALLVSANKQGMMLYALSILATIMPPFAAVTILGASWGRLTARGALAGVIGGMSTAIALVIITTMAYPSVWSAPGGFVETVALDLFLVKAAILGLAPDTLFLRATITVAVTVALTIVVSLMMAPPKVDGAGTGVDLSVRLSPRVLQYVVVLLLAMLGMVVFFSYSFR